MTVGKWDPDRWQRDWKRATRSRAGALGQNRSPRGRAGTMEPPRAPRSWAVPKLVALAAVAGILLGAGAAASRQALDSEPDMVGVCHATGSETQPYVFLIVDRDGYEHGHHRHHEGDYFMEPSANGCRDDVFVPPNSTETDGNETNETEEVGDSEAGNATNETAGENETSPDGNASESPEDNSTGDGENGTESGDNESEPEEAPAPPPGDASIRQSAWQDEYEVLLTLETASVGGGSARNVTLRDDLPDVRRTWYLGGQDASSCVLDGRSLTCWFGDLEPGESRSVTVRAFTDWMLCGQPLTNTARLSADDDAEARNDSSSAGIAARPC